MTLSELLALIGRSWSRLLLYPGGLAAFGCVWLIQAAVFRRWAALPQMIAAAPILAVASAWLGIALLPLPGAVDLGRGIDVVVALALLDLPLLAVVSAELRANDMVRRTTGVKRLAAMLNGYPAFLLALLLLAFGGGSLELATLARAPEQRDIMAALHWLGVAALVLALPPVLGVGAFTAVPAERMWPGLALRGVGYTAIAALPLIAPWAGLWQTLPACALALLLWLFHHVTAHANPRPWARGYLALDLLLLLALIAAAIVMLWQRLLA